MHTRSTRSPAKKTFVPVIAYLRLLPRFLTLLPSQQRAQAWELQNWVVSSRQRTEDFFRNGPRAPTTWFVPITIQHPSPLFTDDSDSLYRILSEALPQHKELERDFIAAGDEGGVRLYVVRAPHEVS